MHYNPAVFFQGFLCYSFFYSIETVLEEKVVFFVSDYLSKQRECVM